MRGEMMEAKEAMNMQEPKTFGECLTELLRRKNISAADLARRMNYRSKTSVSRLLRDEVRYASIEDFMQRLEPVSAWMMTGEEMRLLREAMEVNRLGRTRYQTYRDIWRLVNRADEERTEAQAECFGSAQARTLHELAQSWRELKKLDILIVNSGFASLFGELEALLRENPAADISIRHYLTMYGSPGSIARQAGALMPVFHDPRYQGYYWTWKGISDGGRKENANLAVVCGVRPDGGEFLQTIAMQGGERCMVYESGQADMMEFLEHVVDASCQGALPLKTQYPEQELIEGLIVISRRYLNCEQDRATSCLAPNVCFELIPYEVLYRVMFDSALKDFDPEDEQIARLAEVHRARYANIHGKKKPTTFIFSWEGMNEFARTGRTTDHIAGMREFTPGERAAILRDLAARCRENVYLHVYILRPEIPVRGMTLTAHGGMGVYLLDAYTQYDVAKGHSETFILMPEFAEVLDEFFRDELIGKCTFSEAESLSMLDALADGLE